MNLYYKDILTMSSGCLCKKLFDALDFVLVCFTRSNLTVGTCSDANIRGDPGNALSVHGYMASVNRL